MYCNLTGLHMAVSGPQAVRGGRHDPADRDIGEGHRREPPETVHGRLDIHLHRPSAHLRQSVQADEVLHSAGDRHVSGSGE